MSEQRVITDKYLQLFVETIMKGNPVKFVQENNLLAVDHPELGYLVVKIGDKVITYEEEGSSEQDSDSS